MLLRELFEEKARRIVAVMPGGFHPFHPGHKSLYDWAVKTFGQSNVYVAATNDTAARPFPFDVKKKLAGMAGVPESNFIQVKSPFNAMSYKDIVDSDTALVFVRSQKDKNEQPLPDQTKKNGELGYLRTYTGKDLNTADEMGYMAYGPTINFDFSGMQIKSASELRTTWPEMSDEDKLKAAKLMYGNGAPVAVELLNKALGDTEAPVGEDVSPENEKKFHNELDDLVHKYFGDSPDEEKKKKEKSVGEVDIVNKKSMAGDTKTHRYTATGARIPTSDTSKSSDITKKAKQVDIPNDTVDDFDFSGVDGAKLKKTVARLVSELPGSPKNIKVLQARFGLEPFQKAYTLKQIADAMRVTPEVVRQREAKAIRMLKHPSRSRELRPFLDESNPFTDARMNAIKANKDTFTVGGKTYKVTGDTSDEEKAVQEAELNEVAPAVAAVIWILKWAVRYGAWPVLKWLLKKHGGKIIGGAAAAYYIDQGWDWVKDKIGAEYAQMLIDNKFEIAAAVALILGAVALKKYMEKQGEKLVRANESMIEKAPPGREKQVKALKKKFDDPGAPYAIAWAQHNKKKK